VKIPERPTRTFTGRGPCGSEGHDAADRPGPGLPPAEAYRLALQEQPAKNTPAAGGRPLAPYPSAGPGSPRLPQPASINTATAAAQASGRLIGSPSTDGGHHSDALAAIDEQSRCNFRY
jgi:hypothetical protein